MTGTLERAFILGLLGLFALLAWAVLGPITGPAFQQALLAAESASYSSASTTSLEIVTSEIYFTSIDPIEDGEFQETNLDDGPEGPMPRPPALGENEIVRIYILQEAGRKVLELRNQGGQIIARVQWTLSDPKGFFDNWQGGMVWSQHVKVATQYGGGNIGLWAWKLAERIFYEPGITRVLIDEARTRSGQIGWTSHHLPSVLSHIETYIAPYTLHMADTVNKIWVIQYAP